MMCCCSARHAVSSMRPLHLLTAIFAESGSTVRVRRYLGGGWLAIGVSHDEALIADRECEDVHKTVGVGIWRC
eukprot:3934958-Rhodomonas_salina.2